MMRCSFCGHEFAEESARAACQSCAMSSSSCGMLRCPNCGYEMPGEARLFRLVKRIRSAVGAGLKPAHAGGLPEEERPNAKETSEIGGDL